MGVASLCCSGRHAQVAKTKPEPSGNRRAAYAPIWSGVGRADGTALNLGLNPDGNGPEYAPKNPPTSSRGECQVPSLYLINSEELPGTSEQSEGIFPNGAHSLQETTRIPCLGCWVRSAQCPSTMRFSSAMFRNIIQNSLRRKSFLLASLGFQVYAATRIRGFISLDFCGRSLSIST